MYTAKHSKCHAVDAQVIITQMNTLWQEEIRLLGNYFLGSVCEHESSNRFITFLFS